MSSGGNRYFGGAGAMALLAATLVTGCGSGSSTSGSLSTLSQATPTGRGSSTVGASSSTVAKGTSSSSSGGSTGAKSAKPSTHEAARVSAPQVGGRLLRRFTGSGNARLGTIVVSDPSVLVWVAQHPPIQVFTTHGFMLVSSRTPTGVVQLSRGTYAGTRVGIHGDWTIELRTRS